MSGIALAILVISLISGVIFALYWARKNKRNMKASYPGLRKITISFEFHSILVVLLDFSTENGTNYMFNCYQLFFVYFCSSNTIGPILTATLPDKQTLWLHGNTLLKPMHSVTAPNPNINSEYAEVAQIMPKSNLSAPPEPYATVR